MVIYILHLEQNKYYVGQTNNLKRRLDLHRLGYGIAWLKKHRMINCMKTFNQNELYNDETITKMMMHEYGIDNVRGGPYKESTLSPETVCEIKRSIFSNPYQDHYNDSILKRINKKIRSAISCKQ